MKKAEVEAKAKEMAEAAFKDRPFMDEIALGNYLMTEEARAQIPWNSHTTYQAMYKKTYKALQVKGH